MKTLLLILLAAAPAFAQVTPTTPTGFTTQGAGASAGVSATVTGKPKPLSAGDKKFVKDALESMFFELELTGKTKNATLKLEETKKVAGMLKTDLDKVWADVGGIASAHNEKIPTELAGSDKSKAEKLGKAGDKFDKEYLKMVGSEAAKLAKTFDSASKSSDAEIKALAEKWAPTLKDHVGKIDEAEKEAAKAK